MITLVKDATIVNEGKAEHGSLVIENETIKEIVYGTTPQGTFDETVNAGGCFVLPGVIDSHVHFRDPGLTHKADMESESRAAAYGGVTSYMDMPNTMPQTTTIEALEDKFSIAKKKSHVNYSFFFGSTNDNHNVFPQLDTHRIPGIKLFMGSSTGNMLVDSEAALDKIFSTANIPIMTHCEDTTVIEANMRKAKELWGDDPDVCHHPWIRSEEACYKSTELAVSLANKHNARLHVAHITTAKELELLGNNPDITAEVTVSHLYFCDEDYARLGTLIKCNPAIKSAADREALRKAINDGRVSIIGTDHAPHLVSEKQGGCSKAASGMPMLQFSLVTMLELVDNGVLTIEQLVNLMCHNPARLFEISKRGYIREGYYADIAIVRRGEPWEVTEGIIQSKCKWSPMLGHRFSWRIEHTFCNGHHIYNKGIFNNDYRGKELSFRE